MVGCYPPPERKLSRRRLLVLVLSVVVLIALVAGLLMWRAASDSSMDSGAQPGTGGSVGVLREKDPICDQWLTFGNELSANEQEWAELDHTVPATRWTPEQREIYTAVGEAMGTAADQYESILPLARHTAVQELAAQTIVYLRAYVERIPTYAEADGRLAGVASNFGSAVSFMCTAVPHIPAAMLAEEQVRSHASEPAAVKPFMPERDSVCAEFVSMVQRRNAQLGGWLALDPAVPAAQWSPRQRRLNDAARHVLDRDAGEVQDMASRASSAVLRDLLMTDAAYLRATSSAIAGYQPDDKRLWEAAVSLSGGIMGTCRG